MSKVGNASSSWMSFDTVFHLQQAFKLALSMTLFYWLALWMNWDVPKYGGLAILIISLGTTGATVEKGLMRLLGTTVGVFVGMAILALFCHDRWATLLAFVFYLTLTGYFMQTSRYPYAWYVAAFVPLVIWGDNYPNFESAFYFGTFRYLNTAVGVLIYTMVDLVFWPRQSGDQLNSLGRDLLAEIRELFINYRRQLERGTSNNEDSALRTKLAGTRSQSLGTLQQACFDTPSVMRQRGLWQDWQQDVQDLAEAMELWQQSFENCRGFELNEFLPNLNKDLDSLQARLDRIILLWQEIHSPEVSPRVGDSLLMRSLTLDLDRGALGNLPHLDRAALAHFVRQFEVLDRYSRELLRIMRDLAGLESVGDSEVSAESKEEFNSSIWDPERFVAALYPPVVFAVAFLFWIYVNPPTGAAVPMFAGIISVLVLQARMNPQAILLSQLLSLLLVIAPIYWLVMPSLSTGFGLLCLMFIYCFVFGFLGGLSPALKSGPIIMFVVATGISNQQKYTFQGLVDASLMILIAGTIVMVIYFLFIPMRPEQAMLSSLRRLFKGCVRVVGECLSSDSSGKRLGKRHLETMVLPASAKIQGTMQSLDYTLDPHNTPAKVEQLRNNLQNIAYRLESLESAQQGISQNYRKRVGLLVPVIEETAERAQFVFQQWADFDSGDAFKQQQSSFEQMSRDLQNQLEILEQDEDRESISDDVLADIYALLGCLQGLINAMAATQDAINQINWQQWATPRF